MAFVHLHNHTEYSLLDGATHVADMVKRAGELGMPAIAITDHGVMCGVPELRAACKKLQKDTGITVKPIYGCEIYFTTDEGMRCEGNSPRYHMILLAKTNEGYHNLVKLVTESHVDNFYYKPRTTFGMLKKYSKGLIGTSACLAGIIPRCIDNGQYEEAVEWARKLAACFEPGDFYIELQNQGINTRDDDTGMTQTELNRHLARIAKEVGLQTIATNDFHYLTTEDAPSQDIMMMVGMGKTIKDTDRMRFKNDEFYMKTEEEMREALREFPEACDNTVTLAEKCNVELETDQILPRFPLPEGETEVSWFRKRCEAGLARRYGENWRDVEIAGINVGERYEYEAGIIIQQGFPAYFLIVEEYIGWARNHGIQVGPGRGSAAGAIVTYALGITDFEPLANGLMFERFLSPERVEMPDIDTDFEDERRDEVIDHIKQVYGEDHVSQVITFNTLKAKAAVKDAARVLDYPYELGERICKMIGDDLGITLDAALGRDAEHPEKRNPDLIKAYQTEPEVRQVIDAAHGIEGNVRGEGVHPCATIICRDPMVEHVPLKRDTKGGGIITQYDGHYTPELGLLKMDFLGLRTLSVLSRACRNIKARYGIDIDPGQIPIEDKKAMKLIASGDTDGLFQVESQLYKSLFSRIPPRKFSDIVAAIALNRPGPLESGMVDDYVDVVKGKKEAKYYDDRLRPILEETYGTIVYQEQLMQISMVMSGFSAGKADKLRKAMGKKQLETMQALRADWEQGAVDNGYSLDVAVEIWTAAEKFAAYAFNKSHSAAYAILVMRTAYLKAHYPYEFMAAVLSSYMGTTDKLIKYIASCNHGGIRVLPPDINSSDVEFTAVDEGVRFGLVGVRGIGTAVAEQIIAEREQNGPFRSLHDFVNRLDSKCYNRKTLEALVKGGAFDSTGYTRRQLMSLVDDSPLLEMAAKRQKDKDSGQLSMFDLFAEVEDSGFDEDIPQPDGIEWEKSVLLRFEKDIMGIYVSDHPLSRYEDAISKVVKYQLGDLAERKGGLRNETFVGMVTNLQEKITKLGKRMATFMLEDSTGRVQTVCFDYEKYRDFVAEDAVIKIKGKFEKGDRNDQIVAYEIEPFSVEGMEEGPSGRPKTLVVSLTSADMNQNNQLKLNRILQEHPGRDGVVLMVSQSNGSKFRAQLPVRVDAQDTTLVSRLAELFSADAVKVG